jgi:hypothetical protein
MIKINLNRVQLFFSILAITLSSSFFSCTENGKNTDNKIFEAYRFEKENEFLIHSLTKVELLDYYPEDKLYLGYSNTSKGKEICLVDESGKILLNQNMQGEGPEQHSSNLSSLAFNEDGDIWAMTSVEVLRYDQNLNLIERFSYQPTDIITLYAITKRFSYFRRDNSKAEITFTTIPSGTSRFKSESRKYFDKATLLEFYDQREEIINEIAPISERQITKDFMEIAGGFYAPVYVIDPKSSELFLTSTFDHEITVYDLNTDIITRKLEIFHGDPNAIHPSKKIDPQSLSKNADGWLMAPKNHNIYNLDNGLIALEYIKGVSINPTLTNQSEIFEDVNQNMLIIFDQNHQLSQDLTLPVKGAIRTSLPGNRLLVRVENPEIEEDFTRYIILKVVKE